MNPDRSFASITTSLGFHVGCLVAARDGAEVGQSLNYDAEVRVAPCELDHAGMVLVDGDSDRPVSSVVMA